jgi:hypothetical protein
MDCLPENPLAFGPCRGSSQQKHVCASMLNLHRVHSTRFGQESTVDARRKPWNSRLQQHRYTGSVWAAPIRTHRPCSGADARLLKSRRFRLYRDMSLKPVRSRGENEDAVQRPAVPSGISAPLRTDAPLPAGCGNDHHHRITGRWIIPHQESAPALGASPTPGWPFPAISG